MTHVWHSLAEVPADFGPTVVTLGNFDGVHRGHQALLSAMVADAADAGRRSVAMTFDPHPLAVHRPEDPPVLITGIDDRVERLAATGLDAVLVQPYSLEFAAQGPERFVRDYLVDGLGAAVVVIGADTKFGSGNSGDASTMVALGEALGFDVHIVDKAAAGDGPDGRPWSSTWVRELLTASRVAEAAQVLGRPHRLRGTVVHGDALGRDLGFPTANLDITAGMIPGHGVYAGLLTVLETGPNGEGSSVVGEPLPSAVSLGFNYTVGGNELRCEAHVIDRDLDLYGATVALDFVDYRRPMLDFGSMEALAAALAEDVAWCRNVIGLFPSA